jgi:hypothetical protein
MGKMFHKYVAALLSVWYCMSIIGFDVHSCTATGNVFVNSVLSGVSCEDIHPDHDCTCHDHREHTCSCCHDHESPASESFDHDDECCTDRIEILDEAGITTSEDNAMSALAILSACLFVESDYNSLLLPDAVYVKLKPDSWCFKMPDVQAVLNIWRI